MQLGVQCEYVNALSSIKSCTFTPCWSPRIAEVSPCCLESNSPFKFKKNHGSIWQFTSSRVVSFLDLSPDLGSRRMITLPETNISPLITGSQKESSIPTIHFQVRLLLVSGSVPDLIGDIRSPFFGNTFCNIQVSQRHEKGLPECRSGKKIRSRN